MDDRNPAKLLLSARDILTGVMLPWHLGDDHRSLINELRNDIERAVDECICDKDIGTLLTKCVETAKWITTSSVGVPNVYGKMDRSRLALECLLDRFNRDM